MLMKKNTVSTVVRADAWLFNPAMVTYTAPVPIPMGNYSKSSTVIP